MSWRRLHLPLFASEDFGDNFTFKLYVFYDLNKDVGTNLRMVISHAFHEAGFRKNGVFIK